MYDDHSQTDPQEPLLRRGHHYHIKYRDKVDFTKPKESQGYINNWFNFRCSQGLMHHAASFNTLCNKMILLKSTGFCQWGNQMRDKKNLFCCMNHNKNLRLRNKIYHRALVCIFVFNKILKKLLYWIYILYWMTECLPVLICHGLIWY